MTSAELALRKAERTELNGLDGLTVTEVATRVAKRMGDKDKAPTVLVELVKQAVADLFVDNPKLKQIMIANTPTTRDGDRIYEFLTDDENAGKIASSMSQRGAIETNSGGNWASALASYAGSGDAQQKGRMTAIVNGWFWQRALVIAANKLAVLDVASGGPTVERKSRDAMDTQKDAFAGLVASTSPSPYGPGAPPYSSAAQFAGAGAGAGSGSGSLGTFPSGPPPAYELQPEEAAPKITTAVNTLPQTDKHALAEIIAGLEFLPGKSKDPNIMARITDFLASIARKNFGSAGGHIVAIRAKFKEEVYPELDVDMHDDYAMVPRIGFIERDFFTQQSDLFWASVIIAAKANGGETSQESIVGQVLRGQKLAASAPLSSESKALVLASIGVAQDLAGQAAQPLRVAPKLEAEGAGLLAEEKGRLNVSLSLVSRVEADHKEYVGQLALVVRGITSSAWRSRAMNNAQVAALVSSLQGTTLAIVKAMNKRISDLDNAEYEAIGNFYAALQIGALHKANNVKLSGEMEHLTQSVSALRSDVNGKRQLLLQHDNTEAQLQKQVGLALAEAADEKKKAEAEAAKRQAIEIDANSARVAAAGALRQQTPPQQTLASLMARVRDYYLAELAAQEGKIAKVMAENSVLKTAVGGIDALNEAHDAENKRNAESHRLMSKQVADLSTANLGLLKQINTIEAVARTATTALANAEARLAALQTVADASHGTSVALATDSVDKVVREQVEGDLKKARAQIQVSEAEIAELGRAKITSITANATLAAEVEVAKRAKTAVDQELAQAVAQKDILRDTANAATTSISKLTAQLAAANAEKAELERQLRDRPSASADAFQVVTETDAKAMRLQLVDLDKLMSDPKSKALVAASSTLVSDAVDALKDVGFNARSADYKKRPHSVDSEADIVEMCRDRVWSAALITLLGKSFEASRPLASQLIALLRNSANNSPPLGFILDVLLVYNRLANRHARIKIILEVQSQYSRIKHSTDGHTWVYHPIVTYVPRICEHLQEASKLYQEALRRHTRRDTPASDKLAWWSNTPMAKKLRSVTSRLADSDLARIDRTTRDKLSQAEAATTTAFVAMSGDNFAHLDEYRAECGILWDANKLTNNLRALLHPFGGPVILLALTCKHTRGFYEVLIKDPKFKDEASKILTELMKVGEPEHPTTALLRLLPPAPPGQSAMSTQLVLFAKTQV